MSLPPWRHFSICFNSVSIRMFLSSQMLRCHQHFLSLPHYTLIKGVCKIVLCLCALGGQSCWGPLYLLTYTWWRILLRSVFQLCGSLSVCCIVWSWRNLTTSTYFAHAGKVLAWSRSASPCLTFSRCPLTTPWWRPQMDGCYASVLVIFIGL